MLVVGEEEERSGDLSVRKKGEGDLGKFSVEAFAKLVTEEISQMLA
jgi:threonyl-tRNA synthetase